MFFQSVEDWRLLYVLDNLREADARELCAACDAPHPTALLERYARGWTHHAIFHVVGETAEGPPIALIGVAPRERRIGEAHLIATDLFPRIGWPLTAWVKEVMAPSLVARGFRRIECRAAADNRRACQWLLYLGARVECRLSGYGAGGEDFLQFAWRPDDVQHP